MGGPIGISEGRVDEASCRPGRLSAGPDPGNEGNPGIQRYRPDPLREPPLRDCIRVLLVLVHGVDDVENTDPVWAFPRNAPHNKEMEWKDLIEAIRQDT